MTRHGIADYRPSDQEDVIGFFRDVLGELGFEFRLDAKDGDLLQIPRVYQSDSGLFLLTRRQGKLVGTIALRRIAEDICELKRFYVRKECRGRGLGTALLHELIERAKLRGWGRVRLDTTSKSPAAISLFRKHGFVEIARYNNDPFAEIFMELSLH